MNTGQYNENNNDNSEQKQKLFSKKIDDKNSFDTDDKNEPKKRQKTHKINQQQTTTEEKNTTNENKQHEGYHSNNVNKFNSPNEQHNTTNKTKYYFCVRCRANHEDQNEIRKCLNKFQKKTTKNQTESENNSTPTTKKNTSRNRKKKSKNKVKQKVKNKKRKKNENKIEQDDVGNTNIINEKDIQFEVCNILKNTSTNSVRNVMNQLEEKFKNFNFEQYESVIKILVDIHNKLVNRNKNNNQNEPPAKKRKITENKAESTKNQYNKDDNHSGCEIEKDPKNQHNKNDNHSRCEIEEDPSLSDEYDSDNDYIIKEMIQPSMETNNDINNVHNTNNNNMGSNGLQFNKMTNELLSKMGINEAMKIIKLQQQCTAERIRKPVKYKKLVDGVLCLECNTRCDDSQHYHNHKRIHNKRDKLCPFEDCHYAAKENATLRKHLLNVHLNVFEFWCDKCNIGFTHTQWYQHKCTRDRIEEKRKRKLLEKLKQEEKQNKKKKNT